MPCFAASTSTCSAQKYPGIKILVHPECPMEVVDKADVQGSTGKIIREVEAAPPGTKWAIGTELHLVNRLKHEHPEQEIHFLSPVHPLSGLFADRIGGANYGKGTAIYKFEKIKRAKRKALAEHPERTLIDFGIGENDEMADARGARGDGRRDQPAGEPRLRRQRHRGLQGSGRPVHAAQLRRRARSGQGDQPLHRLEDGAGDAAGARSSIRATSR